MKTITPQEKLELMRGFEKNPSLAFLHGIELIRAEMKDILSEEVVKLRQELPLKTFMEHIESLKGTDGEDSDPEAVADVLLDTPSFIEMTKGKDGTTPSKKLLVSLITPLIPQVKDGKTPSDKRLRQIIKPLIPKAKAGKDGETPSQEKLLSLIKSILPFFKEEIKKELDMKPLVIAEKLNTLTHKVDRKVIRGLDEYLKILEKMIRQRSKPSSGGSHGGGMGIWTHQAFPISSATTAVTLTSKVAANGNALLVRYQGQVLAHNVQYSILGKVITLLFTPEDSTILDVTYVRT